jgi:16S rRNA G966 N2-methylase RsmD
VVALGGDLVKSSVGIVDPESTAVQLRVLLEQARYALATALIRRRHMELPFVELHSETRIIDSSRVFSPLTQLLIRLFMLGEVCSVDEVEQVMSAEELADLVRSRILTVSGGGIHARWLITTFLNRYFLASPPLTIRPYSPADGIVYVGAESFWLARFVAAVGPYASALDIGTGTGLLACMADANRVVGIDIDPQAAAVASFNVLLNGLEEKVEIEVGDLYGPVEGRTFDLIVANPPFMPTMDGMHLPLCGDGGSVGDEVLKKVLLGLDAHLTAGGQAMVYAETFGDYDEPSISEWLRQTDLGPLHLSMFIRSTQSLEAASLGLTLLWQETGASEENAWRAWNHLAEELGATYHHAFVIMATRGRPALTVHHPYRV